MRFNQIMWIPNIGPMLKLKTPRASYPSTSMKFLNMALHLKRGFGCSYKYGSNTPPSKAFPLTPYKAS